MIVVIGSLKLVEPTSDRRKILGGELFESTYSCCPLKNEQKGDEHSVPLWGSIVSCRLRRKSALEAAYVGESLRHAERRAWSLPPDAHGRSRGPAERASSWWWKTSASKGGSDASFQLRTRLHSNTDCDLPTIFPSAMILRCSSLWPFLASTHLLFALGVAAQDGNDPFNCHVRANDLTYDLTPLQGDHTVSRTRETPPSNWVDSVRFDLCADLTLQDGVAAGDQVRSNPSTRFQVALYSLFVPRIVPIGDESMPDKDEPKGR